MEKRKCNFTINEVKEVFPKICTSHEIELGRELAQSWEHRDGNWELKIGDWKWDLYTMLAYVFIAGKLQGAREVREKNRLKGGRIFVDTNEGHPSKVS